MAGYQSSRGQAGRSTASQRPPANSLQSTPCGTQSHFCFCLLYCLTSGTIRSRNAAGMSGRTYSRPSSPITGSHTAHGSKRARGKRWWKHVEEGRAVVAAGRVPDTCTMLQVSAAALPFMLHAAQLVANDSTRWCPEQDQPAQAHHTPSQGYAPAASAPRAQRSGGWTAIRCSLAGEVG